MTTVRREPPFRVGLAGYGLAGAIFHAPLIAATSGLRLAVIVTSDAGRQRDAARAHPDARVVENAAQLWAQARELDLVVIASPNRTHVPLALEALANGLHVVVDKPLAPSVDEARRPIAAARERGLLLTVFQNRRWDGDFLTIRRLLLEGALGDVLRFESRFERWRPVPRGGWRERGAPEEAGGLLFDLGSHLIDQALVLFGSARQVYAELDRRRPSIEVDDDTFVALTHANGVRSHLFMSAVASQPGPRFCALGTRAGYVKWGMDSQEAQLRQGQQANSRGYGEEPPEQWGQMRSRDEVLSVPTERGDYRRFYVGVVDALQGVAPPPVDVEDAVAGLAIIEAARRSSAERQVVPVDA